jgi:lipoprotein-anchoring transpeptidase ErfK/SrfK
MRGWCPPRIRRDVLSRGPGLAAGAGLAAAGAVLLMVTACGAGGPAAPAGPGVSAAAQNLVAPARVSAAVLAKLPRATTYATISKAPGDPAPFTRTGGLVVHPRVPQIVYAGPGKQPVAVLPAAELGGPAWVPVVQTSPGWERVLLPSRPNRATGWIYTGGTRASQLVARRTSYLVLINLGARTLRVYDGGQLLGRWTVAIGSRATPTPTGRTFLLASLAPQHPTYSPLILPLGFHSNTLTTFGGGPGTVGLHGWPNPSVFGRAVSHGCVRVPANGLQVLSRVPLGSLVLITAR